MAAIDNGRSREWPQLKMAALENGRRINRPPILVLIIKQENFNLYTSSALTETVLVWF